MKDISRREFLNNSLLMTCAAMFFPLDPQTPKKRSSYPSYLQLYQDEILDKRVDKLYSYYENCCLCPRDCRVDRLHGETGKCQASHKVKVSSAAPHFGEESPLVGKYGSGTIFFSNCSLRCVFCQNYSISIDGEGVEISDKRLAESMLKIQKMGCHNINLVTPTHYAPNIMNALKIAIPLGLNIPIVYNTSGYEKIEVLQLLDGIVDVYLPDFKYTNPQMAAKYSDQAYNYPHYAKMALKEMHRQVGDLKIDGKGIAVKGIVLRHLVLPNRIAGTEKLLKFVSEDLSKNTYLNIMRQYRPEHKAKEYPEIARRLTRNEYQEAINWSKKFGLNRLAR